VNPSQPPRRRTHPLPSCLSPIRFTGTTYTDGRG
jgi:hypothetical protein